MAAKILIAFILSIIFTIGISSSVRAEIFINEFSYQSGSDWVELYNSECEQLNLEGWKIKDSTESQYKSLSGTISGKDILSFDLTFLNNATADKIRLFPPDNQTVLVQEVSIPIVGAVTTSDFQSVGLDTDGGSVWKVFDPNTKNQRNSSTLEEPCPTPTVSPTPQPVGGATATISSYSTGDLVITEVMPYPEDSDEWIEIYNTTDKVIELSNFQIDDSEGGSKPSTFSKYQLSPLQFFVYYSSSVFNNSGDSVRILQNNQVIDSYTYPTAVKGVSFAKDQSGNWQKTTDPTPGEENSIQLPVTPTPTPQITPTAKPSPTAKPTPTPKIKKSPTPKILSAKTSIGTASAKEKSDIEQNKSKNNYMPFYLATSAVSLSFLGHTVYVSNRKKIHKKFKKNKLIKKLKSFPKIV